MQTYITKHDTRDAPTDEFIAAMRERYPVEPEMDRVLTRKMLSRQSPPLADYALDQLVFSSNSGHLMTVDKAVTMADGFNGMRLRTPSPVATEVLNLLGSVPVPKPMTELYELAAGGVVDGAVLPIDTFLAFKLDDVLKQMNLIEGGLYNTMMVVGMNPAKWEQISEEDRAAIEKVSGEHLARINGEVLQEVADNTLAVLDDRGVQLNRMPDDEITKMKDTLKPVWDNWIAKAKDAGMTNPGALLTDLAELAGGGL